MLVSTHAYAERLSHSLQAVATERGLVPGPKSMRLGNAMHRGKPTLSIPKSLPHAAVVLLYQEPSKANSKTDSRFLIHCFLKTASKRENSDPGR